ncbi:MAG TPA: metallophosphoesterase [Chloroflexia bacterium]|nr:metallophosphoesterase [Chloroflexia bacterium]
MRFVVLGDLHYSLYPSRRLSAGRDEFFSRLFEKVAATAPEAVFLIGDVSHTSRVEELAGLREVARRAGVSHYYMVNGNHDLFRLTPEEIAQHNYNPRPGYFSLRLDKQGAFLSEPETNAANHFIILNTGQWGRPLDTAGVVDEAQLRWLAEEIARADQAEPLFVLGHHPLRDMTKWAWLPQMSIRNSQELWQVLSRRERGVGFYFCGHNHNNSSVRRDNWLAVQTAAPLVSLSFRLVEILEREVKISQVGIGGGERLVRLAGLLSTTQANITNLLSGQPPVTTGRSLTISW